MNRRWSWWLAGGLLALGLAVRVWFALRPAALWWDEAIYLGMAKWLFSGGTLGYWEYFRPPLFAFVLGAGWWTGLPIIAWGRFLALFSSAAVMFLTFLIGERVRKGVGLVALALLVPLPTFFFFGTKLLTGVPATALALLAVWLFMRERYFFAGLLAGLAFLTRFTHGVFFAGLGLSLVVAWLVQRRKRRSDHLAFVSSGLRLGVGFLAVLVPYLLVNLFTRGDALAPFLEASRVFVDYNNWVYGQGNWYYLREVLSQNVLFVLSLVGLWFFVVKKWWREASMNALVFPMLLVIVYFLRVAHKEVRFFIPAFPFLAILVGVGVVELVRRLRRPWYCRAVIVAVVLVSLVAGFFVGATVVPEAEFSGPIREFYNFFGPGDVRDAPFISSSPLFMAYTDKPFQPLRSWELANKVYAMYSAQASHVAIDACDHPCEPDSECEQLRTAFIGKMDVQNTLVFNASYVRWDGVLCPLLIWERQS